MDLMEWRQGGFLFGAAVLRAGQSPRLAALLSLAGLALNLLFALIPVPEIAQIVGGTLRNAGIVLMGLAVVGNLRQVSAGKP
jgi:hypothetical protein